jgi:putative spermidine/putrescine transport system permease protein
VFLLFFLIPLALVAGGQLLELQRIRAAPGFTLRNYLPAIFEGCGSLTSAATCASRFATYLSTFKFCLLVWASRWCSGSRSPTSWPSTCARRHADGAVRAVHGAVLDQQRDPHDLLGAAAGAQRAGQPGADGRWGLVNQPVEWLLFSDFSVVLAFVHLYTMFMIVPIFNSMMRIDRSLLEAASDAGASAGRRCGTWWCRCRAPAS